MEPAGIGPSILIEGTISGEEDLLIHGRVVGTIDLGKHHVTIGPEGSVKGDVTALVVTIEGSLEGTVVGKEQIAIRASGTVQGDLSAPRIHLEDGAKFKGSIDMDFPSPSQTKGKPTPVPEIKRPTGGDGPHTSSDNPPST